ncbi:hypothetical protein [Streptomyces sp. SID10815]|uniref:hypothetical protein n=1 Tax=Streptomyces sp. SID10815 TaxID=2706027 RepID=UPI0013C57A07|nr:hypothetical protein [Streptomyces sp. SID10815]NEA46028.1 hypothetical protein [Streptomyces sp. SID10815]
MTDAWTIGSTVATAAAALVALGVAVNEGRTRVRERADRDAAQARLLLIRARGGTAHVDNYTDQLFLEVRWISADAVKPGSPAVPVRYAAGERRYIRPLPAQGSSAIGLAEQTWDGHSGPAPRDFTVRATVHYLDAAGLWWSRTGNEQPVRLLDGHGEPQDP